MEQVKKVSDSPLWTKKFSIHDDPSAVLAEYRREGVVVFRDLPVQEIGKSFRLGFSAITEQVYRELGLGDRVNPQTIFDHELMQIHRHSRAHFSALWNASQSLPGLYSMLDHPTLKQLLQLTGMSLFTSAWTPNVRIDCPHEDDYILPDHQDRHYNGGSENACTVYFQLNGISPEKGRLNLRPRSHLFGSLPYKEETVRPYFHLRPGAWSELENYELALEPNDIVVFHMDLVHRSAVNRGDSPRVTLQLRYSNFMDPLFKSSGWAPLFVAKTTENNLGLNHSKS